MIVKQKLDNCENHGLQYSWKVFELHQKWGDGRKLVNGSSFPPTETPIREKLLPLIMKQTTHIRKCQNCLREELFEMEEVRKWVVK